MRQRIYLAVAIFLQLTAIFLIAKGVFVAFNPATYTGLDTGGFLSVLLHGLPMDICVSGYLAVLPALTIVASVFIATERGMKIVRRVLYGEMAAAAIVAAVAAGADTMLYPHWGMKLDTTPLFYLFSSPSAAAASGGFGSGALLTILLALLFGALLCAPVRLIQLAPIATRRSRLRAAAVGIVLTAALFFPIRGGVTVSTMNLSRVYFSDDTRLNHAAVNPLFSFLYSATHQSRFDTQFRYFDNREAKAILAAAASRYAGDTIAAPELTTEQPDICLVILESFSAHLMPSLGGADIAPRLDSIAGRGWLFTRFYASSYRTDRALPAILSGYPGQPTTSIMKFVGKTERLESFPAELKRHGYDLSYYYGGDINFTSMKAYLVSAGFSDIVCDKDFPLGERLSKWGAPDHLVFRRHLADRLKHAADPRPQLTVIQTSSSHEPFDVPYTSRHTDPRLNAFAYADHALGEWIDSLSHTPRWDRTLVVITADHFGLYPDTLTDRTARHHVPLVLTGGALKSAPRRIDAVAAQTDIAATLLALAGISADSFPFSCDIFDPAKPRMAFFTDYEHASIATRDGSATVNLTTDTDLSGTPDRTRTVRAYLQNLYNDLQNR